MVWIIVVIALILVFGLGSVLEAAFWTLVILALLVLLAGVAIERAID
jgi:hypothetical protein